MQVQHQPPLTPANPAVVPPLDWPHYGIGFIAAIKRGFVKYATFSGRASRSEYWWWTLFTTPILVGWSIVVQIGMYYAALSAALGPDNDELLNTVGIPSLGPGFKLFACVIFSCVLAIMVPTWAVTVRRLHDSGHSGWTVFLSLIPLVGSIILLVYVCSATGPTSHQYGPPGPGASLAGPDPGATAVDSVPGYQSYSNSAYSNAAAQSDAPHADPGYASGSGYPPGHAMPAGGSRASIGDTVAASSAIYSNGQGYPAHNSSYPGSQGYPAATADQQPSKAQSNKARIAIIAVTAVVVAVLVSTAFGLYTHLRSEEDSASSDTKVQTESAPSADSAQEADPTDESGAGNQGGVADPADRYGPGSGIGGDSDDPGADDPEGMDSDSRSSAKPQLVGRKPPGSKACPSAYDLGGTPARSAVNSKTTSCDFGEEVRRAYLESGAQGDDVVLRDIYSPFTHKYYKMTCSGSPTVTCTGGVQAEVFLY